MMLFLCLFATIGYAQTPPPPLPPPPPGLPITEGLLGLAMLGVVYGVRKRLKR
ncbi:hypothetical protein ACFQ1M_13430 [Sungkyunkwania multivorans]|uniref:PEP-CTERM protein-sorting domain-containing protein n=1 Tax=Sungkyunkwania multivorans TaxID=1173618 RepID=A0ABW3D249_9FLAO